ncbi:hypothetical protein EJB05_09100, partial [Eragrostis curvula]
MSAYKSQPPTPIAVEPSRGGHLFEVANYSQHRELGVGSFLRSATFHVGGCAWCLRFYPSGESFDSENEGYVSVAILLMTQDADVTVLYDLRLINHVTSGARYSAAEASEGKFDTRCVEDFVQVWCVHEFMRKSELEASPYLRDDRLVIECTLRVIKGTRLVSEVMVQPEIVMPPSDLPDHLGCLLKDGMGADVTFDVQGKSFPAHRMLLAARSPVFKAELLGPMKEGRADRIAVHEIQPEVFEALLHFVYTDSLPSMDDGKGGGINLVGDLLVAADRYAMDRLKLVCERILSRSLTVDNVSAVLVLANRHNCTALKDACVEFVNSDRIMDDVTRTQGYAGLKSDHPYVLIELFEKVVKLGKMYRTYRYPAFRDSVVGFYLRISEGLL